MGEQGSGCVAAQTSSHGCSCIGLNFGIPFPPCNFPGLPVVPLTCIQHDAGLDDVRFRISGVTSCECVASSVGYASDNVLVKTNISVKSSHPK